MFDKRELLKMELFIKIKIYIWKYIEINGNQKVCIMILASYKVDFGLTIITWDKSASQCKGSDWQ